MAQESVRCNISISSYQRIFPPYNLCLPQNVSPGDGQRSSSTPDLFFFIYSVHTHGKESRETKYKSGRAGGNIHGTRAARPAHAICTALRKTSAVCVCAAAAHPPSPNESLFKYLRFSLSLLSCDLLYIYRRERDIVNSLCSSWLSFVLLTIFDEEISISIRRRARKCRFHSLRFSVYVSKGERYKCIGE